MQHRTLQLRLYLLKIKTNIYKPELKTVTLLGNTFGYRDYFEALKLMFCSTLEKCLTVSIIRDI